MPAPNLPFTDTISVTHAIECYREGINPYLDGRCDPWLRRFNYPPIWLQFGHVGVSAARTNAIGTAMGVLALLALVLILPSRTWASALLVVLTVLSPAVMFGIERGNVDMLLFAAVAFGLFGTQHFQRNARMAGRSGLIVGLTALKLYPVAACSVFFNRESSGWWPILIAIVAMAAFAWLAWEQIPFIFFNTPLTSFYSFGAAPLLLDLAENRDWSIERESLRWLASGLAVSVGWVAALCGSRVGETRLLPRLANGTFIDDLCIASLATFSFCFLLGSNFNYRLIVLVGAMPCLLQAYDRDRHFVRLIAPTAGVALLWAARLPTALDHTLNWLVYVGACSWLAQAIGPRLPTPREREASDGRIRD